jgi:5'-3' exonuclease
MGIPAYYKKLISSVNGLLSKSAPTEDIDWLWMDFNCLIYHCLYRDDLRQYPGIQENDEWEKELIENVVKYTQKIITKVNPKQGVRICIDGVVPMAKMRQQRLRRFKSSWLHSKGIDKNNNKSIIKDKNDITIPQWDTNSITPGTQFMTKLKQRLERLTNRKIHISSSDEPGEGEHKIMMDWRTGQYNTGNFAIYGLDADLIVLTLLNKELCNFTNTIYLFREEINSGKIQRDSLGEEEFEWFSINALHNHICKDIIDKNKYKQYIINYCFTMSILGNDFLPSSLGLKMRDDGHTELIEILNKLMDKSIDIVTSDFNISRNGLFTLFSILSVEEPHRISYYIYKKMLQAKNLGLIDQSVKLDIGDNNCPLLHIEEMVLKSDKKDLVLNWEDKYMKWFSGFDSINGLCEDYLYTIQWTWNYYIGKMDSICYNWYYPHRLPPLWKWLRDYLDKNELSTFPNSVLVRANDITTTEQLCIVLPLDSWHLIPPCKQKELPQIAPQYFPEDFTFDTIGKRFFWECEAEIPLISICEIKALFS